MTLWGTLYTQAIALEPRNQRVKIVAPLTITLSDILAQFLLPVPTTLCSTGLEAFVPEAKKASIKRHISDSIEQEIKTVPSHFVFFILQVNKQRRES